MEKPFRCPMAACDMAFTNEDHLTVHKKKHEFELSLSLTPTPSFKNSYLMDQTPTPTRFILESFEFDNPFDATFRRANSTGGSSVIDIPESSSLISSLPDSEVLNTPSITLPSEPATPITLRPNFFKKRLASQSINLDSAENNVSKPFIPGESIIPAKSESPPEAENSNSLSYPFPGKEETLKDDQSKNVLQTSVITSVGNSTVLKSNGVGVPTAVVVTRPSINNITSLSTSQVSKQGSQFKVAETVQTVVQPMCVAPVVNLMIRLPDGQTVQLPAMVSTTTTAQPQTVAPIAPFPQVSSSTASTPPNAKMRLKEALAIGKKTVSLVTSTFHEGSPPNGSLGSSSPPSSPVAKRQGRKRRDFCDPEEKRKRCLERNRAAATRCREKRKMWVTALERKADEMARINSQLQKECKHLRNEVSNLKTMLLAHKDCPVTMQQRAQQNYERENCTTIRIITSAADDVQLVPSHPIASPLHSEFLEMEVSSVQSSSDTSSLASEASELSCKER